MKTAPHFGVRCPCGQLVAKPIAAERVNDDPVDLLRSLSPKDQRGIVGFMAAHGKHGECVPCIMDIEPVAQA